MKSERLLGRTLRATAVMTLAVIGLLGIPGIAQAHSAVDITYPADGQVLETTPVEIAIGFNEVVTMPAGSTTLIDSAGSETPLPQAVVESDNGGSNARLSPIPELADGWYAVRWNAVSSDGHPVKGTFTFYVGNPDAAAAAATVDTEEIDDPVALYRALGPWLRGLTYLAVLLAIGALAGAWAMSSPKAPMPDSAIAWARRVAGWSAAAGLVLTPLTLANTAIGLNGGISDSLGATLQLVLQSSSGASLLVRMSALFAACTAVLLLMERVTRKAGYVVGLLAAVGAALSFAMSGHAAVIDSQLLASAAQIAHLVAASLWLAAIPVLAIAVWFRRDTPLASAVEMFNRYSRLATVSVVLVFAAGAVLSFQMFSTPDELVATEYGVILLVKVALVALLALIGAYNHFVAVPALRKELAAEPAGTSSHSHALRMLKTTLLAETVGFAAVLVATSVLTLYGAPKAIGNHVEHQGFGHGSAPISNADIARALSDLDPKTASAPVGAGELEVSYLPGKAGRENRFTIWLYDKKGQPSEMTSARIAFSLESAGLGPIERQPELQEDGSWLLVTRDLGLPGSWDIRVDFETPDGSLDFMESQVEIAGDQTDTSASQPDGSVK